MSEFHEKSYRSGVWVGQLLGAMANGCKSMAATWPEHALPEHREQLEAWARLRGLSCKFEGRLVTIEDPQPPKLELVN
jgi:hypothetical protein